MLQKEDSKAKKNSEKTDKNICKDGKFIGKKLLNLTTGKD